MRLFLIFIINLYQKFISPRKGFCCAFKHVNGGSSCSEYGKSSICRFGAVQGVKLLLRRLRLCGKVFRASKEDDEKEREDKNKDDMATCLGLEAAGQIGCCALSGLLG